MKNNPYDKISQRARIYITTSIIHYTRKHLDISPTLSRGPLGEVEDGGQPSDVEILDVPEVDGIVPPKHLFVLSLDRPFGGGFPHTSHRRTGKLIQARLGQEALARPGTHTSKPQLEHSQGCKPWRGSVARDRDIRESPACARQWPSSRPVRCRMAVTTNTHIRRVIDSPWTGQSVWQ